jgi:hypothetical protein
LPQPSSTFSSELSGVIGDLFAAERRLAALFDQAGYEELPTQVGNRRKLKANGIKVQRAGLEEIAEGKLG